MMPTPGMFVTLPDGQTWCVTKRRDLKRGSRLTMMTSTKNGTMTLETRLLNRLPDGWSVPDWSLHA